MNSPALAVAVKVLLTLLILALFALVSVGTLTAQGLRGGGPDWRLYGLPLLALVVAVVLMRVVWMWQPSTPVLVGLLVILLVLFAVLGHLLGLF